MNALIYNAPPLVTFMFVMSITPGPNNLMLLGSGARFGLRRTLPHLLGITSGFLLVQFVTFAGLGAVILAYPSLKSALTVACVVYLLWLGYKLLLAGDPNDATSAPARNSAGRPLSFWEATIFQLVNPKAWGAAVPAIGIVARDALSPTYGLLLLLGVSLIVGPPCILVWTLFGATVRPFLAVRWIRRVFNALMSALILATAWWMLQPLLAH
ncbi:MAG TPA: LysE family translocator [Steroidobacteraceae bacterium]|nr:LysE family translocator [Steroidobacteraceae bacterium]